MLKIPPGHFSPKSPFKIECCQALFSQPWSRRGGTLLGEAKVFGDVIHCLNPAAQDLFPLSQPASKGELCFYCERKFGQQAYLGDKYPTENFWFDESLENESAKSKSAESKSARSLSVEIVESVRSWSVRSESVESVGAAAEDRREKRRKPEGQQITVVASLLQSHSFSLPKE